MGIGAALPFRWRWAMNWLYLSGAIISVLLLVYLSVALLWPERFS
jgi:K+-transporting ATPase KdpF subunit